LTFNFRNGKRVTKTETTTIDSQGNKKVETTTEEDDGSKIKQSINYGKGNLGGFDSDSDEEFGFGFGFSKKNNKNRKILK